MSDDDDRDAFVRWQGITISQLTYAVNLVLGFSIAAVGFGVTLLLNKDIALASQWQKRAFALALLTLLASVGFGVSCVVTRLRDFRATMAVARARHKGAVPSTFEESRLLAQRLGKYSWRLFWCQIATFCVGILATVVAVFGVVSAKLW